MVMLLLFIGWMDQHKPLPSSLTAADFIILCVRRVLRVNQSDPRVFQMGVKGGGRRSRGILS